MADQHFRDISAVAIGGFDYIFYIDGSGALAYRKSTDPNEGASKKYTDNSISTASDPAIMVNETAPSVAAVAYQDAQNQNQIRIYYIAKGTNSQLKELCQTNDGDWTPGKLNDLLVQVTPDSGLTANVMNGQLKVYVNSKDNPGKYTVAFAILGSVSWSQRLIQ